MLSTQNKKSSVTTSPDGSKVLVSLGNVSCEINLVGATVTSWKVDGVERLYLSPTAVFDGSKAIRGGVPIIFPQFGGQGKLPSHGVARITKWTSLGTTAQTDVDTTVSFLLDQDHLTQAHRDLWPHKFSATYSVTLSLQRTLTSAIRVQNTGGENMDFKCLLHTYFAVNDIKSVNVEGLHGHQMLDNVAGGTKGEDSAKLVTFTGEVDRVYENVTARKVTVNEDGAKVLEIAFPQGYEDVVVWNPWAERALTIADLPDDHYQKMVCVEAGKIVSPVTLAPGADWHATHIVTV
ncbi:hypothetical protein HK101_010475 [Irineochytrium annulatum]|nr:hypothetical protein HK101_010475 [Irineochytrium annulatum]